MEPEIEKQKQKYIPASIEIIRFVTEDILTVSGVNNIGIDLPIDLFDPIKP